jgi:hypothetical protein
MSRSRRVALVWALTTILALVGVVLMVTNPLGLGKAFTPHSLMSVGFASVGALITLRRPHRIGTLFVAFGTLMAVTGLLFQVCPDSGGGDGGLAALCGDEGRIGLLLWPAGYLFLGSLFLLFPTGRLPSARWRPVAALFFAAWSLVAILSFTFGDRWVEDHLGFLIPVAVWLLATVATAPLFRLRRADAVEKQQLRWVGYVIAVTLLLIGVGIPLDLAGLQGPLNALNVLIFANVLIGLPAAITIAILRYRLYDIDVIVNRTLVYTALTLGLGAAYLGSVVVLRRLFAPVTADSDIAVAASTLAVAVLFRPVRIQVQAFIDRRFYRRKYDALRTLETFSFRLRDQVDLEHLARDLTGVVSETMHPAHVSVWLRPGAGS